jgi:uncharacterized membrane protein
MSRFILALLLLSTLSACMTSQPVSTTPRSEIPVTGETVAFAQIQSLVAQRCTACHSSSPTYAGVAAPAGGMDFTNPQTLKTQAFRIKQSTVTSREMPDRNNITGMTEAERTLLGQWIDQGANIQ